MCQTARRNIKNTTKTTTKTEKSCNKIVTYESRHALFNATLKEEKVTRAILAFYVFIRAPFIQALIKMFDILYRIILRHQNNQNVPFRGLLIIYNNAKNTAGYIIEENDILDN